VLILHDFKSFEPEVLILVGLKSFKIRKMQGFCEILEVLILVEFKLSRINRSEKCGKIVFVAIVEKSAEGTGLSELMSRIARGDGGGLSGEGSFLLYTPQSSKQTTRRQCIFIGYSNRMGRKYPLARVRYAPRKCRWRAILAACE
jgi:hypothetical protein